MAVKQGENILLYRTHTAILFSAQILSDILKDDEPLNFAVEAYHEDLPFDLFQALHYAYIVKGRPDIVQLYNQYAARENTKEDQQGSSLEQQFDKQKKNRHRKTKERRGSLFPMKDLFPVKEPAPIAVTLPKLQEMSMNSFLAFLQSSQGSSKITLNDAQDILFKYDFHFGKDTNPTHVHLRVFGALPDVARDWFPDHTACSQFDSAAGKLLHSLFPQYLPDWTPVLWRVFFCYVCISESCQIVPLCIIHCLYVLHSGIADWMPLR